MLSLTLPDVSTTNYIFRAAKIVRGALLSQKSDMPWPPNSSDVNEANVAVSTIVYDILAWILTDDDKPADKNGKKVDVEEH